MIEADHFARLGLPRAFAIDLAELERNYLSRSRAVHPDLVGDTAAALEGSARLNEAFAVLRDPFRRADYLLGLLGGPAPTEVRQPPADFLEEMLELRMAIAGAEDPAEQSAIESTLNRRRTELLDFIGQAFEQPPEPTGLRRIREQLNALKFIGGLIGDLHGD